MKDIKKTSTLRKAIFICIAAIIITCLLLSLLKLPAISKYPKLSQLNILLAAVGLIAFWRGIWGAMDEYLFPDNHKVSYWVSIIIGFSILILTHFFTKEF